MKRTLILITFLLMAVPALAQTAPDLFIFRPGTSIRADEMNANFQLLQDHITSTLGIAQLTTEDVAELAALVEHLQGLAESGELDGASLEFAWDGTNLGVRHEGEESFTFVELRGQPAHRVQQARTGPALSTSGMARDLACAP